MTKRKHEESDALMDWISFKLDRGESQQVAELVKLLWEDVALAAETAKKADG